MRLLGNLTLAGLGFIENARFENLVADPATPSVGQLWYNTTNSVYRGYDGTNVITFATGGNTATLQTEIDNIEAGVGLAANGTYVQPTTTNYLNATTTVMGALTALDTQAKTNADAITSTNTTVSTLQTEVNAIEAGAGLNTDGTFTAPTGTNYLGGATSLLNGEVLLDTQVKTNSDAIATNTTAITTKVSKAGDTMTGNLVMQTGAHITVTDAPASGTDAVNKNYVDNLVGGINGWLQEVVAASATNEPLTGAASPMDGVTLVDGDRILLMGQTAAADNGVYVYSSTGAWTRTTDANTIVKLSSSGVFVKAGGTVYGNSGWLCTNVDTDVLGTTAITFVQFNGAANLTAGIGLSKTGNVLDVNLGAGIAQLPTDEVGVDILAAGGLFLTVDGTTAAPTDANSQLSILLNGTTLFRDVSGLKVNAAGITATELAASVAGAGLVGGAGSALAVGAGTGITVAADSVAVDTAYLDTLYVNVAGDTMTGPLVLSGDPTAALGAATKQYVDAVTTALHGSFYVYDSGVTSSTSHVVTHNIGSQFCNVTVVDSNNKVIIPDSVTFDSTAQLTVTFSSAITCKVVVSGKFV